jgi:hypothetical protein
MGIRHLASALTIYALVGSVQARTEELLVTHKSLAPEIALDLARAALADCQKRGYQVAIAVVDRSGVVQVVLRDRYAGPHVEGWAGAPKREPHRSGSRVSGDYNTSELVSPFAPNLMSSASASVRCG